MNRADFQTAIELLLEMIQPERQADASEMLTSLSEGFNTVLDANETIQGENAQFKADNERLRKVNTDLFLKVGAENKSDYKHNEPPTGKDEDIPSYDTLFNEKGELI